MTLPANYLDLLNRTVATLGAAHTPLQACAAVDAAAQALVGHRLFTVLYVAPGAREVARIYSSNPAAYPVAGRKTMGPTPWGDLVIKRMQPYVGHNADDIRWAFPDHALIASLGLASVLNISITHNGACVGTLNILDEAGHYRDEHIALMQPFGALLVPLLTAAASVEPGA
jgi:GAF domain-containing protein